MATSIKTHLASLSTFLQDKPHIPLTTSTSSEYHGLREIWALDNTSTPLAIVRPQTSVDVGDIIKFCSSTGIKFTVRSGGHNIFGSSIVQDALCIDLRPLKHVSISSAKTSATIGGGILIGELSKELQKEGLVAASTEIPSVGYVGWASCGGGGYGPFTRTFGLGVDQIIGAKVVNAEGEVKDADKRLLKGIRGAGGAFGVIVEMTIKVYPLNEVSPLLSIFSTYTNCNISS
jgi:FAD/FMN-containing dehydrogenase